MSTDREHPIEGHLRLDDKMLGPYEAILEIVEGPYSKDNVSRYYTVSLSELEALRLHLTNTIDGLRHRQFIDLAAGDCATCGNVRMVQEKRPHGGEWTVHCPECRPRIDAAEQALREGHPPART